MGVLRKNFDTLSDVRSWDTRIRFLWLPHGPYDPGLLEGGGTRMGGRPGRPPVLTQGAIQLKAARPGARANQGIRNRGTKGERNGENR